MNLSDKQKTFLTIGLYLCIVGVFLFLTGCSYGPNMTCSIFSLKDGTKVTIQKKFWDVRLNYLEACTDKDTFYLITRDPEKTRCYIMQYNIYGEKLREYELPFFTDSILTYGGEPRCAFYPAQKLFLYEDDLNEDPKISDHRVCYYDLGSGEKGMIPGIEEKDIAIKQFYVINEKLLLVNASYHTADKGMLYLINIKEKKLAAVQEIPYPSNVTVDIPLSRLSVFKFNSKVVNIYDLRTLKHLFAIPQNTALYLTDCAFAPSGNVMLQAGLGDSREAICLSIAENNHWKNTPCIFSVSTKENFVICPQFYSDQIILFRLSDNKNSLSPGQLCFFDLREKKIIKKYPVSPRGYSKLQGDYLIWED